MSKNIKQVAPFRAGFSLKPDFEVFPPTMNQMVRQNHYEGRDRYLMEWFVDHGLDFQAWAHIDYTHGPVLQVVYGGSHGSY